MPCPHCGESTPLNVTTGLTTTAKVLIVVWALVVIGPMVFLVVYHNRTKKNPPPVVSTSIGSTSNLTEGAPTNTYAQTLNNFGLSEVTLNKPNEGGLKFAVGTAQNLTDQQRFGVRIEFDLLDGSETKVGTASDYVGVIEPNASWHFKALVTERSAVKAVVREIKEN